ncbi:MAG: hypothetical protein Q7S05_04730 [bacterium]|nr:hypothetical protein [bacterium]
MNYINVQNQVRNVFATAFVGVVVLFGTVAMPQFARADDFSYGGGSASDFGCCGGVYFDTATPQDTGTYFDTATPQNTGTYFDTATPQNTGTYFDTATPRDTYFDTPTPQDVGTYYDTVTPTGTYYDTVTPTDAYASTAYDVYDIYSTNPVYDYGNNYSNPFSPSYAMGYGLGNTQSYPFYNNYAAAPLTPFVSSPSVINAPSNTNINAPRNTCTAPNTCNTNTNIDDHSVFNAPTVITNSGNTTVSNPPVVVTQPSVAYVAPVTYAVPQYNVQAYVPQYTAQPTCSITLNTNGYNNNYYNYGNNQTVLSWTSYNATSAYITPTIGNVALTGSTVVYPGNQFYTMTVSGPGGTTTCRTYAASTYVAPVTQASPYVALTQIPYTGFDFGPFGNAMYWFALVGFALAGAYLVVYYVPHMFSFSGRTNSLALAQTARVASPVKTEVQAPVVAKAIAKASPVETTPVAQPVSAVGFSGTKSSFAQGFGGTKDAMTVHKTAHGAAPRIVISRN